MTGSDNNETGNEVLVDTQTATTHTWLLLLYSDDLVVQAMDLDNQGQLPGNDPVNTDNNNRTGNAAAAQPSRPAYVPINQSRVRLGLLCTLLLALLAILLATLC